jgi:hypothetical protein
LGGCVLYTNKKNSVWELEAVEHAGARLQAAFLGEVDPSHLPEGVPGEHAVGRCLVSLARCAAHPERGGDALEAAQQRDLAVGGACDPGHVLDVVDGGAEVDADVAQEVRERPWQLPSHEQLDEVGEVIGGAEGDPRDGRVADEARRGEQRGEGARGDAPGAVGGEVEAAGGEQADRVRRVAVHARVEAAEVDLEGERGRGARGRRQGQADLDEVQRVDVGLEQGVALRRGERGVVDGRGRVVDDARELRVHGHVGEPLDGGADELEFAVHVVRPHLTDLKGMVVVAVLLLLLRPPPAGAAHLDLDLD